MMAGKERSQLPPIIQTQIIHAHIASFTPPRGLLHAGVLWAGVVPKGMPGELGLGKSRGEPQESWIAPNEGLQGLPPVSVLLYALEDDETEAEKNDYEGEGEDRKEKGLGDGVLIIGARAGPRSSPPGGCLALHIGAKAHAVTVNVHIRNSPTGASATPPATVLTGDAHGYTHAVRSKRGGVWGGASPTHPAPRGQIDAGAKAGGDGVCRGGVVRVAQCTRHKTGKIGGGVGVGLQGVG